MQNEKRELTVVTVMTRGEEFLESEDLWLFLLLPQEVMKMACEAIHLTTYSV